MSKLPATEIEDAVIEKSDVPRLVTQVRGTGLTSEEILFLDSFSEKQQNRIFHKVDLRLVPILALLYLVSNIDRANIANAKIEGIEDSLGMAGTDYNIALVVFFIPYILFEVPSNYILTKFRRPSQYIGGITIGFGIIMVLQGVVTSFGGLVTTRFFLGLFEAGFFPGSVLIIGIWYPPTRTQTRTAMFFCAAAVAGAFSGLLAGGIAHMDGLGNYEGWRWIFILEGIATVIAGFAAFYLLPSGPSTVSWLSPEEARFLELTHIATRGRKSAEPEQKFNYKTLWGVLSDYRIWLQGFIMWSNTCPGNGLKFTLPQIIRNMGFTSTTAQFLSAPPYFIAAISALVSAHIADKYSWRMPVIVGAQLLIIVGNTIQFVKAGDIANNIALCYFATFVSLAGSYPIIPGINAWSINNLAGGLRRAIGIAFMLAIGSTGGIVGSFIFINSESPKYPTGFGTSLSIAAGGVVAAFILEGVYWYSNKVNDQYSEEDVRQKYTDEELEQMGDKSPLFRYAL